MTDLAHIAGIKALGPDGLERLIAEKGLPAYRHKQLVRWLYGRGVREWSEMTDLPAALRESLAREHALPTPELLERQVSSVDDTRKYLWRLADGATVESVGIPTADRLTVCFSTQVGCGMGCTFCATGAGGLRRNLAVGEIVDQVRLVGDDYGLRVSNAVAMGQGEPFANYDAVLGALRFMNSPDGLGIGARHLTVSTCGILAGIQRFSTEPEQFTLAVSLHSAVQVTRDRLLPGLRGARLPALREALQEYTAATGRRVTLEYALIAGETDTAEQVTALGAYARGLLCHVNLIPMNPVMGSTYTGGSASRAAEIARQLTGLGVETTVRTERGVDISAACGQLQQRHDSGDAS